MNYTINENIHNRAQTQLRILLENTDEINDRDIATLELLSDSLNTFYQAQDILNEQGLIITNMQNNIISHPAMKIKNAAQIIIFKILTQFGVNLMDIKKLEKDIP